MPAVVLKKVVAVDLDGVLASNDGWQGLDHFGEPLPGAVEFTKRLSEFADVLIWTTRCNEEMGRGEKVSLLRKRVQEWLDQYGFVYADIYTGPVKPIASAFVDDRAVKCRPQEDVHAYELAAREVMAHCLPPELYLEQGDVSQVPNTRLLNSRELCRLLGIRIYRGSDLGTTRWEKAVALARHGYSFDEIYRILVFNQHKSNLIRLEKIMEAVTKERIAK